MGALEERTEVVKIVVEKWTHKGVAVSEDEAAVLEKFGYKIDKKLLKTIEAKPLDVNELTREMRKILLKRI
jgi:hypothetical protein